MSAIRQPGKINDNTTLIDIGMYDVTGVTALYLIRGEKTCLIDGGTRTEAARIIKALKELNAFPPNIVLLTHSHYDHVQAVPAMRRAAAREGKTIEVLASHKAIPFLEDQSYNEVFDAGPYENIPDVTPLQESDIVDLGGLTLRIYEIPGHHDDHVAILDEKNKNIFVGDTLGIKVADDLFIPPFMPPLWDPDAFRDSVEKLRNIDYLGLSLAHFGYIYDAEARTILDEAIANYKKWWGLFEQHRDRIDDKQYLLDVILNEVKPGPVDTQILSLKLRLMFGLMTTASKLMRRRPRPISEFLLLDVVGMLATGYKTYQQAHA